MADTAQKQPEPKVKVIEIAKPPRPAHMKKRHWLIILSFLLFVVVPAAGAGYYLYTYATDQFASRVGFTVRREESSSASGLLSGLSSLSNASSSDTDILYEFIQSQEMVREVDAQLDLREIYQAPEFDPVFALRQPATIEDLLDYWSRMVRLYYDPGTGLIEVEARAFDPQSAQAIAQEIFRLSSEMINQLSAVAREDTTRYAREELDEAVNRLKEARQALTLFRNQTQIVDVGADLQGQMGVLTSLQEQLAAALIEVDLLSETTSSGDPRLDQARRRIEVIQRRIAEERAKVGGGGGSVVIEGRGTDERAYADLVGEFESLQVDLKFAEESYLSARAAFDTTIAEARRQNRYLAAYVRPTLAEAPQYPQRLTLLGLTTLVLFGIWVVSVLVFYSLRDRR